MRVRFVYNVSDLSIQPGHVFSFRADGEIDSPYPHAMRVGLVPTSCRLTGFIEIDDGDLDAIFLRGEKTIDTKTKLLCDDENRALHAKYLSDLEKENQEDA